MTSPASLSSLPSAASPASLPSLPSLPFVASLPGHAAFSYDPSPDFGASPWPFVIVMLAGFVIGVAGHVVRARSLVVVGIGLIFLATFLLPLGANILRSSG